MGYIMLKLQSSMVYEKDLNLQLKRSSLIKVTTTRQSQLKHFPGILRTFFLGTKF